MPIARTVILIRTNEFDSEIAEFGSALRLNSGLEVVFVVDERKHQVDIPTNYRKISLTVAELARLGLPIPHDVGWRCGDYPLYLAREQLPDVQVFWQIETDVLLNFSDIRTFFDNFRDCQTDFIAVAFRLARPNWWWHRYMAPFQEPVSACLFPLVRISATAVDYCFRARQRSLEVLQRNENLELCPNDESFVATTLQNGNFSCKSFNDFGQLYVYGETFVNGRPLSKASLSQRPKDGRLYHPVRSGDKFRRAIVAAVGTASTKFQIDQLQLAIDDVGVELGSEFRTRFEENLHRIASGRLALPPATPSNAGVANNGFLVRAREQENIYFFVSDQTDYIQKMYHLNGDFYERLELDLLRKMARPNTAYVDVGSHTGNHLIYVGQKLSPSKLIPIEPNQLAQRNLMLNLGINGLLSLCDLRLLPFALGNTKAAATLKMEKGNWGNSSVSFAGDPERTGDEVQVVRGDDHLHDVEPGIIKIDVGRSQVIPVLLGLSVTITRARPILYLTYSVQETAAVEDFLQAVNYKVLQRHDCYNTSFRVFAGPS